LEGFEGVEVKNKMKERLNSNPARKKHKNVNRQMQRRQKMFMVSTRDYLGSQGLLRLI